MSIRAKSRPAAWSSVRTPGVRIIVIQVPIWISPRSARARMRFSVTTAPVVRSPCLPTAWRARAISAVDGLGAGEGAADAPVPVPGVVEVALERVDDAVEPRGEIGLVLLDDLVGRLPVTRLEMGHGANQMAAGFRAEGIGEGAGVRRGRARPGPSGSGRAGRRRRS